MAGKNFNTIILPIGYAESQTTASLVFTCITRKFSDKLKAETSLALYLLELLKYRYELSLKDNSKSCCELETGKYCSKCGFLLKREFTISANDFENFITDMMNTCCDSYPADAIWECPSDIDEWNPFLSYPIIGPPHIMGEDSFSLENPNLVGYPEKKLARLAGLK